MITFITNILEICLLIFTFLSGIFEKVIKISFWLVSLKLNQPTISIVGEIFVKFFAWAIPFYIVGQMFKSLGWFNYYGMKLAYAFISIILAFLLSYVIMLLEKYILYIAIAVVSVFALFIILLMILKFLNKKKKEEYEG